MESFKSWMQRVVGERPDITADWNTPNAETLVSVKNTYKSEEVSVAAFHLMVVTMCTEYMKRMSSIQFADSSEKKAALEKLGLTNSKTYRDIIASDKTREEVELLNHFKVNFPNSMFMKLEDFKALCRKYGLVCGCINEFSGEIPDKNIKEIEAALEIINNTSDDAIQSINKEYYTFSSIGVVDNGTKYFKEKLNELQDDLILFHFRKIISDVFFNAREKPYLTFRSSTQRGIYANKEKIPSNRMLIAAPSNLMGKIEINYKEAPAPNPLIKDDPIVFQLLPYDIVMIHSKWGDEASDPMLEERKL